MQMRSHVRRVPLRPAIHVCVSLRLWLVLITQSYLAMHARIM